MSSSSSSFSGSDAEAASLVLEELEAEGDLARYARKHCHFCVAGIIDLLLEAGKEFIVYTHAHICI